MCKSRAVAFSRSVRPQQSVATCRSKISRRGQASARFAAQLRTVISQFQNGSPVLIGSAAASCAGNQIGGNLNIQNDTATASVVGNTVANNLNVQNSTAATTVNGNTVTGNLQVQNNTAATTVNGNIVSGSFQDQNNMAPTQVFANIVGNNMQCQQVSQRPESGNTADKNRVSAQCSRTLKFVLKSQVP